MNVVDYRILVSEKKSDLERDVKKALKDGWRPVGGILFESEIKVLGQPNWYSQVVVKEEA